MSKEAQYMVQQQQGFIYSAKGHHREKKNNFHHQTTPISLLVYMEHVASVGLPGLCQVPPGP